MVFNISFNWLNFNLETKQNKSNGFGLVLRVEIICLTKTLTHFLQTTQNEMDHNERKNAKICQKITTSNNEFIRNRKEDKFVKSQLYYAISMEYLCSKDIRKILLFAERDVLQESV